MSWTPLADAIRMVDERLVERHARDLRQIETELIIDGADPDDIDRQLGAFADLQQQDRVRVRAQLQRLASPRRG